MRIVSSPVLKGWTVVVVVRRSLTRLKSSSILIVHVHAVLFLSSGLKDALMCDRPGIKAVSWLARPRNDLS